MASKKQGDGGRRERGHNAQTGLLKKLVFGKNMQGHARLREGFYLFCYVLNREKLKKLYDF